MPTKLDQITWDFQYHAPDQAKIRRHETVRNALFEAAKKIDAIVPDSREKSLAITNIEQAMFWAHAGIARTPRPEG